MNKVPQRSELWVFQLTFLQSVHITWIINIGMLNIHFYNCRIEVWMKQNGKKKFLSKCHTQILSFPFTSFHICLINYWGTPTSYEYKEKLYLLERDLFYRNYNAKCEAGVKGHCFRENLLHINQMFSIITSILHIVTLSDLFPVKNVTIPFLLWNLLIEHWQGEI